MRHSAWAPANPRGRASAPTWHREPRSSTVAAVLQRGRGHVGGTLKGLRGHEWERRAACGEHGRGVGADSRGPGGPRGGRRSCGGLEQPYGLGRERDRRRSDGRRMRPRGGAARSTHATTWRGGRHGAWQR